MADYPTDRSYTTQHEWVLAGDASARVGITTYAAESLGDVVYVTLPEVGAQVSAGEACGELESTKAVEDLYSPVSGVVTAVNDSLADTPELINSDPHGEGWLFEVETVDGSGDLLDAEAYAAVLD